jgi:GGDEF domain-containing protein
VTDEIRKRRKIEAERDYDPLTGLYNRRRTMEYLENLLKAAETPPCSPSRKRSAMARLS